MDSMIGVVLCMTQNCQEPASSRCAANVARSWESSGSGAGWRAFPPHAISAALSVLRPISRFLGCSFDCLPRASPVRSPRAPWTWTRTPASTPTEAIQDRWRAISGRKPFALRSLGRRFILKAQAALAYVRWLIVNPMLGLWVAVAVRSG